MAPIKRIRQSITQAEDDLARLAREAKQLQREIDSLDQRVQLTPQRERQFEDLERDYRVAKQAYDSLLARYSEAELAQSFERNTSGETFRILDAALPPTSPAAPNRIRLLMMICFLAIGLAGGALLLAEQLDTSFHTTDDVRRFTTVPVLASVPVLRTSAQLAARGAQLVLAAGGLVLVCGLIAWGAYTMARGGDQLVWLLARGQL